MRKQLQQLLADAERQGFVVALNRNGHYKVSLDGRCVLHTGSTPSDPRALKNLRSQLRRALRQRGDTLAA